MPVVTRWDGKGIKEKRKVERRRDGGFNSFYKKSRFLQRGVFARASASWHHFSIYSSDSDGPVFPLFGGSLFSLEEHVVQHHEPYQSVYMITVIMYITFRRERGNPQLFLRCQSPPFSHFMTHA